MRDAGLPLRASLVLLNEVVQDSGAWEHRPLFSLIAIRTFKEPNCFRPSLSAFSSAFPLAHAYMTKPFSARTAAFVERVSGGRDFDPGKLRGNRINGKRNLWVA